MSTDFANFSDFNRMLSEVNTPQDQQGSMGQFLGGQKNELYIFPPISFKDNPSAKLLYTFAGQDSYRGDDKTSKIIEKAYNANGNAPKNDFTSDENDEAFDYFSIKRNLYNPERTSKLSKFYSFVYVSHSPKGIAKSENDMNIIDRTDIRVIIYGFFSDIPVGMGYSDINNSYNHSARLIPTHKTVLSVLSVHNSFGSDINYKTILDTDIYNENFSNLLIDSTGNGKSFLMPHDQNQFVGPNVINDKHISTNIADPKTHMSRFVKGLSNVLNSEKYSRNDAMSGLSGGLEGGLMFDSVYTNITNDSTRANLIQAFDIDDHRLKWYNQYTHINDFGNTTLGDLISKHGVTTCVLDSDNSNFIRNSADTNADVHKYDFTSILSSISTTIMHHLQITSISFRYSSYGDIFEIIGKEPQLIVRVDSAKAKDKINNFIYLLKNRIFKWIQNTIGEFELSASLNVHSNSYIKLDPDMSQNYKDEYVAMPSITGGLSTPLLGDPGECQHNADQVDLLSSIISDESDLNSAL